MTYEQFKSKYNGKYVDYDGYYGYQCWDLGQYYFTQVLNVPDSVLSGCGNIKNMILRKDKYDLLLQYFDEVSTIGMQPGDVCIWTGGEGGHIGIFDYYNDNDKNCYYFQQDPFYNQPCMVKPFNQTGHHAFRRKGTKPTPVITPNVDRDESKTQLEVKVDNLRIRNNPSLSGEILGMAKKGIYNILDIANGEGYTWYKIADSQWVAYNEEWETILPAKEDEYVKFKVISKKDDIVEIDLGKVYIKP